MSIKNVDDNDFEKIVLQSKDFVLVDYWAEWCGPCKVVGPILEELAQEGKEGLTIAKMDIDENPETPTMYGIRSIPTLMLFKDGKKIDSQVGALSKTQINQWIKEKMES